MRQTILAILLGFNLFSCSKSSDEVCVINENRLKRIDVAELADTIQKIAVKKEISKAPKLSLGKMIMISSGQISPGKEISMKGISFDFVEKNKDTTYLSTSDKKFKTPEGFHIGMPLSELPNDIQKNMIKEPGWAYYYTLPSGWSLGFCEGNACTDNYPTPDSEVKWIFKRSLIK